MEPGVEAASKISLQPQHIQQYFYTIRKGLLGILNCTPSRQSSLTTFVTQVYTHFFFVGCKSFLRQKMIWLDWRLPPFLFFIFNN